MTYDVSPQDRTNKTHPFCPSNPNEFREGGGGGVLIAHRTNMDIKNIQVGLDRVQTKILTVWFTLSSLHFLAFHPFLDWELCTLKIIN